MDEPKILVYGGLHQFLPTEKLGTVCMYECRYSARPSCIIGDYKSILQMTNPARCECVCLYHGVHCKNL